MTTQIIPLQPIKETQHPDYGKLPGEDAFNLVASLHDRAERCNRSFNIQALDITRHRFGLCIGLTDTGDNAIAVVYLADGLYAWYLRSLIHVIVPHARFWTAIPLEVGMHYLLGSSNYGVEHVRAEPWGTAGRLKDWYFQQHNQPQANQRSKSNAGSDESDGAPPVNHPSGGDFPSIKSLDELGL